MKWFRWSYAGLDIMEWLLVCAVLGTGILVIATLPWVIHKTNRLEKQQASIAQSYTPSNAPVFATQLHTNVIMSANGGRTVFVTR